MTVNSNLLSVDKHHLETQKINYKFIFRKLQILNSIYTAARLMYMFQIVLIIGDVWVDHNSINYFFHNISLMVWRSAKKPSLFYLFCLSVGTLLSDRVCLGAELTRCIDMPRCTEMPCWVSDMMSGVFESFYNGSPVLLLFTVVLLYSLLSVHETWCIL